MSDEEEIPLKKKKKGVRNISDYRCSKIRTARVKGVEYVNWKNKTVPAAVPTQELR